MGLPPPDGNPTLFLFGGIAVPTAITLDSRAFIRSLTQTSKIYHYRIMVALANLLDDIRFQAANRLSDKLKNLNGKAGKRQRSTFYLNLLGLAENSLLFINDLKQADRVLARFDQRPGSAASRSPSPPAFLFLPGLG